MYSMLSCPVSSPSSGSPRPEGSGSGPSQSEGDEAQTVTHSQRSDGQRHLAWFLCVAGEQSRRPRPSAPRAWPSPRLRYPVRQHCVRLWACRSIPCSACSAGRIERLGHGEKLQSTVPATLFYLLYKVTQLK
ncbi:hypothetical protein CesoFtcFv8_013400 [Champsocephalus esox]|uniref:Uncharacterized protein n=1 Tax=Champsocephalus esox TaxID=159716 RepID=A0AAN8BRE6_9TELE|nr:hypothetical protein CesoFtcFv8_013400 [Champsocephalus esox]